MDNKEEGNGKYNSDTDKMITLVLAYGKEGDHLLLFGCLRRSFTSNVATVRHLNEVRL